MAEGRPPERGCSGDKDAKPIYVAACRCGIKHIAQQTNGFRAAISARLYRLTERCRKVFPALAGVIRAPEMCVANNPNYHSLTHFCA